MTAHITNFFLITIVTVLTILTISSEARGTPPTVGLLQRVSLLQHASYCGHTGITDTWDCFTCQQPEILNFKLDAKFQNRSNIMFGYVGHVDDTIIAVFRGTVAISPLSWIMNNFRAWTTSFPSKFGRNSRVHKGFTEAFNSISKNFIEALQIAQYNCPSCNNVIVTGHSLGGAVATIASLYVTDSIGINKDNIALITSGAPRVGNMDFVQDVLDSVGSTWRMVQESDPVPHVPPSIRGPSWLGGLGRSLNANTYVHFPSEIWNHNGVHKFCSLTDGEDPQCSRSVPTNRLKISDHSVFGGFVNASFKAKLRAERTIDQWCITVAGEDGWRGVFSAHGEDENSFSEEEHLAMALASDTSAPIDNSSKQQSMWSFEFVAYGFLAVGVLVLVVLVVIMVVIQKKFIAAEFY